MNKENDWDQYMERDLVEGSVDSACREEVLQALNEMKTGEAPGPSDVSLEMITASMQAVIKVMPEICQRIVDGFGMPLKWAPYIVVPIFKGKVDIRNCSCHRTTKFLEHGMKVVEMVLEKGFVDQ